MPTDVFAAVLRALDGGRNVAIASVVGATGSTPRHLGARMAVADDGEQWGTIGGGRIEALVTGAAKQVAGGAPATVIRQHLVRDLAMCCGGAMTVAITAAAESAGALRELAGARNPRVLVTPLDGRPLTVRPPRDGDPAHHAARVEGDAVIELVGVTERAIVIGLGHVARVLGPLLDSIGFRVIVCDDNDTSALEQRPAWAAEIIESFDASEIEACVGGFTADDRVLIVTRDHAIDQQLLERLLVRDDLGYLGMIGSAGKVGRFRKRLEAKGIADEARWSRLHAPIGLDIGAETPEEIAIAIAAELVAHRRRGAR
jgi:xanthine dehydrogenase accessory factor